MKIRFGFTIGPEVAPQQLAPLVDDLERLRFDSLWVPEVLLAPTLDPVAVLAFAAARTSRLKLGSHLILPGKQPVVLARQLAHLDQLSDGRLLLLGVLGIAEEAEAGAQGIDRASRSAAVIEMVPLLRRLWTGEVVDHDGPLYPMRGVQVTPRPRQDPLEMWLAGQVPGALRRCGQLGDGWMPGLMLPHEAAPLKTAVEQAATEAGRAMDPEHFGANLFYATGPVSEEVRERLRARRGDAERVDELVPHGWDALRDRIAAWTDVGFSKFLLRPLVPRTDTRAELETLAEEILPLTT